MPSIPVRVRSLRSRLLSLGVSMPVVMAVIMASLVLAGTSAAQTVTVLHAFSGTGGDGWGPFAPLTAGPDGILYGTTEAGGA